MSCRPATGSCDRLTLARLPPLLLGAQPRTELVRLRLALGVERPERAAAVVGGVENLTMTRGLLVAPPAGTLALCLRVRLPRAGLQELGQLFQPVRPVRLVATSSTWPNSSAAMFATRS